ncbi:MAG: sensor domain-containing diguanylate cyclase [Gammaproteobacteria bacterium]|nr:sensor domain-containing diguanylate cyclase [Gammaproteobacteria bacterium]MBU1408057.1 sensor domain-containing diguanylate cyclase [Gammaproteobacteria bacterium]MBU1532754.1 sensor domain-containing diguanylate cyclase [Gammaproteobacteria bacterium]
MNIMSSAELASIVSESLRQDMVRYFAESRKLYTGPWRIEEFDHRRTGPGFSHEELVDCLHALLVDPGSLACRDLMMRMCRQNVPYVIAGQEVSYLRDALIRLAIRDGNTDAVSAIVAFFDALEDALAKIYLTGYLDVLSHRNDMRLRHIGLLAEKNLLIHFEKHLDWLKQLTAAVSVRDRVAMPEARHDRCEFGKWLHGEGTRIVRDKSHYTHLVETHAAMHRVVEEIDGMMGQPCDSLPIYALMKKAENYSLDIGNEIAMLNSMVIMINYNKDPMTGSLTRRSLERVMINQLEISRATETPFCLLMCDIDRFKQVNDNHGHTVGDRAIVHFANALRSYLRQSDLMFRFGGDEFLLMLPSTSYQQGWDVAEKLRGMIAEQPVSVGDETLSLQASFGLLEVSGSKTSFIDSELVNNLIKECDQRLYLAKHRGRNQIA